MQVIGVDVGGTKIAGVRLDVTTGDIRERATIPTQGYEGTDAVLLRIAGLVRDLCDGSPEAMCALGIGLPATIDYETGTTVMIPNIAGDWRGKPVRQILRDELNAPVWLINDARAFTLAEANLGAGKGWPVVACFTLGTGIGGGIAVNGELLMGAEGSAGEFGHHCVDLNGPPDGSGTPGAMEVFASGPAIAAMGAKAVMQGVNTRIGELVEHDLNRITPRVIMQAAELDDPVALDILARAGRYLGVGIANVVTILNPHCIVVGGGVAQLGKWILEPIRATLAIYNNTTNLEALQLRLAELGEDAGALGAALWAYQQQTKET